MRYSDEKDKDKERIVIYYKFIIKKKTKKRYRKLSQTNLIA